MREIMLKCGKGFFVEFGARNGISHSNTAFYEKEFGWTGMLFEADAKEYGNLKRNRPNSQVFEGAVCPKGQDTLSFAVSRNSGWSGSVATYEESRKREFEKVLTVKCWHLPTELRKRGVYTVDYMTIDTEGSELSIVRDFPWHEFDVKLVQIEQLDAHQYPSQRGKKEDTIRHMNSVGYDFVEAFQVARGDTEDLIFVPHRNDGGAGTRSTASTVTNDMVPAPPGWYGRNATGATMVLPSHAPGFRGPTTMPTRTAPTPRPSTHTTATATPRPPTHTQRPSTPTGSKFPF